MKISLREHGEKVLLVERAYDAWIEQGTFRQAALSLGLNPGTVVSWARRFEWKKRRRQSLGPPDYHEVIECPRCGAEIIHSYFDQGVTRCRPHCAACKRPGRGYRRPENIGSKGSYDKNRNNGLTLEEVGRMFGLSRESIRHIELKGLQKFRRQWDMLVGEEIEFV